MLNFFIGFAFFEAGAFFGFFVADLLNAAVKPGRSALVESLSKASTPRCPYSDRVDRSVTPQASGV